MFKFLGALVTIAVAVGLLVLAWPQFFGFQDTFLIAQAVALRGALVVAGLVALVLCLLLALARPLRAFAGTLAVLFALFTVANVAIIGVRGITGTEGTAAPAASDAPATNTPADANATTANGQDITVLSWNTLGDAPGSDRIAQLAIESRANVIVLPETTEATGVEVALQMRAAGLPMWVKTVAFDQISPARSTTLLISPSLGDYDTVTSNENRAENTAVLPTVIATPSDGVGPTIVAAHAVSPSQAQMQNWRTDLQWLARQCASDDVIMAGDFNATIDHMAGLGTGDGTTLGQCTDAASAAGAAGLGTWPTDAPALLGSPIDHVMAGSKWTVTGIRVVTDLDGTGSDHRPVVATLSPAS
ncbi:endonuclease/exonuclease/phosphatase family protein [Okibacterium fritillariae]|uniref:endonuclease/exonuclease/phosphatase family protein n=1 Tax=Okibacterium fritillariae TaxID=123320 RepID=UPI0040555B0B